MNLLVLTKDEVERLKDHDCFLAPKREATKRRQELRKIREAKERERRKERKERKRLALLARLEAKKKHL